MSEEDVKLWEQDIEMIEILNKRIKELETLLEGKEK